MTAEGVSLALGHDREIWIRHFGELDKLLSGVQEVHVVGAGCAGLSAAVQLAEKLESACCAGRVVIYVWDGGLQRLGLRRRRLVFREAADLYKYEEVRLDLHDMVILVLPC